MRVAILPLLLAGTAFATPSAWSHSSVHSSLHRRASTTSCSTTSDCTKAGFAPVANSHAKCNRARGSCVSECNTGYTSTGSACIRSGAVLAVQQTCSKTADCSNDVPVGANRWCDTSTKKCSWRCSSKYTTTADGTGCVLKGSTTTTTSAAAATQTCSKTADCSNTIPANSHRYCDKGKCSWRCNTNYASTGSSCTRSTTSPSTSASAVTTSTSRPAGPTQPAATPVLKRSYQGPTFWEGWRFINESDPTHGMVNYVTSTDAFALGLAVAPTSSSDPAILSIDRTSTLSPGDYRSSVRIQSIEKYDAGHLIIADLAHLPHGCSVWPAWWMYGDDWPNRGEVDIFEVVNERTFNQMTLHTAPGCTRNASVPMTGSTNAPWVSNDCYAYSWSYGCQSLDWDTESAGSGANAVGGGVWAALLAETGISIWRWSRPNIPSDIKNGSPRWKTWGTPVAAFDGSTCDTRTYFQQQQLVFDITTCGDWAGLDSVWQDPLQSGPGCYPKYANCAAAVQDPTAFAEAYFEINYVKVRYLFSYDVGRFTTPLVEGFQAENAGSSAFDCLGVSPYWDGQPLTLPFAILTHFLDRVESFVGKAEREERQGERDPVFWRRYWLDVELSTLQGTDWTTALELKISAEPTSASSTRPTTLPTLRNITGYLQVKTEAHSRAGPTDYWLEDPPDSPDLVQSVLSGHFNFFRWHWAVPARGGDIHDSEYDEFVPPCAYFPLYSRGNSRKEPSMGFLRVAFHASGGMEGTVFPGQRKKKDRGRGMSLLKPFTRSRHNSYTPL
ncbi:hypothetical protein JCM8547_001595 [Rhodosporidiobolus lusitaniae]